LSGRLHITRDVVFDESKGWNWSSTAEPATDDTFTVEYPVTAVSVAGEPATTPSPTPSPAPTPAAKEPATPAASTPGAPAQPVVFVSPPIHIPSGIDLDDEGAPRRYRRVTDCINTSEPTMFE